MENTLESIGKMEEINQTMQKGICSLTIVFDNLDKLAYEQSKPVTKANKLRDKIKKLRLFPAVL